MSPETRALIERTIAAHEKSIADNEQILKLYQNGTMRSSVGTQDASRESILWIEAAIASLKQGIEALRQARIDVPKEKVSEKTRALLGGVEGRWGRPRR